jgi:hypothetical protein
MDDRVDDLDEWRRSRGGSQAERHDKRSWPQAATTVVEMSRDGGQHDNDDREGNRHGG